jgi:two-component system, OmpR family, phosphate regulon response regulator PhoB
MGAKVLVVEDEEAISQLLAYNLEREGFRVDVAPDGDEALVAVSEARPDLVLLDWMLPNVSGSSSAASCAPATTPARSRSSC